jgi:hypothetical protein
LTPSAGGLELRIAARGSEAVLTLHNGGSEPLDVFSHVDAGERHYDPFTIELEGGAGTRTLRFYDDRNESARVIARLAPGEAVEHVIDLPAWAERKANGGEPLAAGTYLMSATYEVHDGALWSGRLESPTVPVTIPGRATDESGARDRS